MFIPVASGSSAYRGRFAPSPTGPLHLGSLTAALGSWLMARLNGGSWLLRMEDLDPPREVPGMARRQIAALEAFGLISDEPVVWQSERHDAYEAALRQLLDLGLAYSCRCSRSDLLPWAGIHHQCVSNPSGRQPAYRFRVPTNAIEFDDEIRGRFEQQPGHAVGDPVLKRADGYWAYQLAVVVDDAMQSITHIVRGADLIDSTPRQIALQQALGFATPRYAHLPLIRRAEGEKLSKSSAHAPLDPSQALQALRLAYAWLGQDARELDSGLKPEQALVRALAAFDPARIPAKDHFLPQE